MRSRQIGPKRRLPNTPKGTQQEHNSTVRHKSVGELGVVLANEVKDITGRYRKVWRILFLVLRHTHDNLDDSG
jgi:hypothetical protein